MPCPNRPMTTDHGVRVRACLLVLGLLAGSALPAVADGCPGAAGCDDSLAPDAFLNPAAFTGIEVALVQDALIWTGNYMGLKDGVWGKASVDGIRSWRLASGLPPAVSLRPAEMAAMLRQAAAAKAAVRWALLVDPAGPVVGVPLGLVTARAGADGTQYLGDKGVSLVVRAVSASIETVKARLADLLGSADFQHLVYRLDKPDRQVLSYDSGDGSSVYVRFDRVADGWRGFSARVVHGIPAYASLVTAFSADFDPFGMLPALPDASNAPQLFSLLPVFSAPAAGSPQAAPASTPAPDVMVRALQLNLRRLAYYDGPLDGLVSPALRAAVASMQRDEGVPAVGEPDGTAEELSEAAVARIPPPGPCPGAAPFGEAVVCGRAR